MIDVYDIIKTFGTKYWIYVCPDVVIPTLHQNSKLDKYDLIRIVINHKDERGRESTLEMYNIYCISFLEVGLRREKVELTFYDKEQEICTYTINKETLENESLQVRLIGDCELLESRILTETEPVPEERRNENA